MIVIQVVMNDGRGYDGSDNCGGHGRVYGATVNVVVMTKRAVVKVTGVVMKMSGAGMIVRGAMVTSKAVDNVVRVGRGWRSLG